MTASLNTDMYTSDDIRSGLFRKLHAFGDGDTRYIHDQKALSGTIPRIRSFTYRIILRLRSSVIHPTHRHPLRAIHRVLPHKRLDLLFHFYVHYHNICNVIYWRPKKKMVYLYNWILSYIFRNILRNILSKSRFIY